MKRVSVLEMPLRLSRCLSWVGCAGLVLALGACSSGGDDAPGDEPEAGSAGTSESGTGGSGAGGSGAGGSGAGGSGASGTSAGIGEADGGSGDGGVIDPFEPNDLDDRSLAGLSDAEAVALCASLSALADTIVQPEDIARLGCILFSSVFAGSSGQFDALECEAQVNDCLISDEGVISRMECDVELLRSATVGCELTVGQYRECLIASAEQLALWVDTFSCQYLANPGAIGMLAGLQTDASSLGECAPLMAACPALFEEPGSEPAADGCDDTCSDAKDSFCDDGGPGSQTDWCALGTDCSDCGQR